MKRWLLIAVSVAMFAVALPALAQQSSMTPSPPAEKPATFEPTRQATTSDGHFLVKLLAVPSPIPFEKYFSLQFAVYDPSDPAKPLTNAHVSVFAGMRHGLKTGFAHGMQSTPKVAESNGVFTVSGMYFHMMGPWTFETTVSNGDQQSRADFQLPCCGL
jgi:hypothetical protein